MHGDVLGADDESPQAYDLALSRSVAVDVEFGGFD